MTEFLTWNTQNVYPQNWELGIRLIMPFVVALVAVLVTGLLDTYGAPDDDVTFDPTYDRW